MKLLNIFKLQLKKTHKTALTTTLSHSPDLARPCRALDLRSLASSKNTAISWIKLFFDVDCSIHAYPLPFVPTCHRAICDFQSHLILPI